MPMAPGDIANAVNYFTQKNADNSGAIGAAALRGPLPRASSGGATTIAGQKAAIVKGAPTPGGKVSLASPANPVAGGPDVVGDSIKNVLGLIVPPYGLLRNAGLDPSGGQGISQEISAPMGKDQTPTNGTQLALNFLSGPLYAAAGLTQGIGQSIAEAQKGADSKFVQDLNKGDIGAYIGDVLNPVGKAVQGLGEGLGMRFGTIPRTQGQNLQDIGALDAVRNAAGGLGANQDWQNKIAGVVGGVADAASDPLMWVPGTGLVAGLRGAAAGASDALRAGAGLRGAVGQSALGFYSGRAESLAAADAARLAAVERKTALKSTPISLADQLTAEQQRNAPRLAADPLVTPPPLGSKPPGAQAPTGTLTEMLGVGEKGKGATSARLSAENAALAKQYEIAQLLPNLRSSARNVPADGILASARPAPLVNSALHDTVTQATHATQTIPELKAALKTIKADPNGQTFLKSTITVAGKNVSVGQAIESAATRRITNGGEHTTSGGDLARGVDEALKIGAKIPSKVTPSSLGEAIAQHMPGLTPGSFDPQQILPKLAAATPADRPAILKAALEGGGTPFKTFDEAVKAAVSGGVEASMMRSMLRALGIHTRATKPATLQEMLNGRGRMTWEDVQRSIPTPKEVLDTHGVSPASSEAAKRVDTTVIQDTAAGDYKQMVADKVGFDPLVIKPSPVPSAAGSTGQLIDAGMEAINKFIPVGAKNYTEAFKNEVWLAAHTAIMQKLSSIMGTISKSERGAFGLQRYLDAMSAITAHMVSRGQMPRLQYGKIVKDANTGLEHVISEQPLFLSADQIISALPENVASRALFNLDYRLNTPGVGREATAKEAHKSGLSIYPTTLGNGAREAINGGSVEGILAAMQKDTWRNNFQKTADGQRALRDAAVAMADPIFRSQMRLIHDAQEVAAVAFAQRAADAIVKPLAEKIIAAIAKDGDRSELVNSIVEAIKEVASIAKESDMSLLKDIANQRATNGILNVLGELGGIIVNSDARAATRNGGKSVGQAMEAQHNPAAVTPIAVQRASRGQATADAAKTLHEMRNIVDQSVSADMAAGVIESTELAYVKTIAATDIGLGWTTILAKIGRAFDGQHGLSKEAHGLVTGARASSFRESGEFEHAVSLFKSGGNVGGKLFGPRSEGANAKLGRDLGLDRKATPDELNQAMKTWHTALAGHAAAFEKQHKRPMTDQEMAIALERGQEFNQRKGSQIGIEPLSPGQIPLALEWYGFIKQVFAPIVGPFARSGFVTEDLAKELARYGVHPGGINAHLQLNPKKALADQANTWQGWDMALTASPSAALINTFKAMEAASVRPSIAASLTHMFGHTNNAAVAGKSVAEVKAMGWRAYNTKDESAVLAKYLPEGEMFSPEVQRQLPYLQGMLDLLDKPGNAGGVIGNILTMNKIFMDIWKPLVTSLRPGHHVANELGDMTMVVVLAGMNPLYVGKWLRGMRDMRQLPTSDFTALDSLMKNYVERTPPGGTLGAKPNWADSNIHVTIKNPTTGKLTHTVLTYEQVHQLAVANGVPITNKNARDILPGEIESNSLGAKYQRFAESKYNPASHLMSGVGRFSAMRENSTRIPQFMHELEKGTYSSIEDAATRAAARVHEFHPSVHSLAPFEQRVMRNIVPFYTWIRQAMRIVIEASLERPALVTLPSKFQYNQAFAQGLEPESIGKPVGPDGRIASYNSSNSYGPTFTGGYSPLGGAGDLLPGENLHQWGISLSTPQIDAMAALFGGVQFDAQAGVQAITNYGSMLSPLITAPIEEVANSRLGGVGQKPGADQGRYLAAKVGGVPYALAQMGGMFEKKLNTPAENAGNRERVALNTLLGLKATDYTNSTSAKVASNELAAERKAKLANAGYDAAQIKRIVSQWGKGQKLIDKGADPAKVKSLIEKSQQSGR